MTENLVGLFLAYSLVSCIRSGIAGYAAWKYNTYWILRKWVLNPLYWTMWTPAQYGEWFEKYFDLNGDVR